MLKIILAVLALLLVTDNAHAQQTPTTYCASLPSNSCEVLNVQLQPGLGTGISVLAHVKKS